MAARGIDITGVPFVVNVTLPDDKQNYIHRIGRVGRAERMGLAISIVSSVKEKVGVVWGVACVMWVCLLSRCGIIRVQAEESRVTILIWLRGEGVPSGMMNSR